MIELLRVSISKRATLRVDAAEHLPTVWANAAQIRQVVMNLVISTSEALGEEEGDISVALACVPSGSGAITSDWRSAIPVVA
jgi:nitrogen-specific signal transduction histidine kinase